MAPSVKVSLMPCNRRALSPELSPTNVEHRRMTKSPTSAAGKGDSTASLLASDTRGRRRSMTQIGPSASGKLSCRQENVPPNSATNLHKNIRQQILQDPVKILSRVDGQETVCQHPPAKSSPTGMRTVPRYLPLQLNGVSVLTLEDDMTYRADNSALGADTSGIVYRVSKDTRDWDTEKTFLAWGSTIAGTDEGDGWIKCAMRKPSSTAAAGDESLSAGGSQARRQKPSSARLPLQVLSPSTTERVVTTFASTARGQAKPAVKDANTWRSLADARSLRKAELCAEKRAEEFNDLIYQKLAHIWRESATNARIHIERLAHSSPQVVVSNSHTGEVASDGLIG